MTVPWVDKLLTLACSKGPGLQGRGRGAPCSHQIWRGGSLRRQHIPAGEAGGGRGTLEGEEAEGVGGYERREKEGGMREGPREEMSVGERRWVRDHVFYSCGSHLWIQGIWIYGPV